MARRFPSLTLIASIPGTREWLFPFADAWYSIMMALNLSHDTLLRPGDEKRLPPQDVTAVQPPGQDRPDYYVKHHVSDGLLPMALVDLLAARKKAKKDQEAAKKAGDENAESIANGRQLALKVVANSGKDFCAW